ncbi:MAG: MarR family winged helix-turn-helix transcriptional regulator [Candidatus Binataceae bacterium]
MTKPLPPARDVSMPVLLRHARAAYASAMRAALAKAGYEDIPQNGLYVIGALAPLKDGCPLSQLIGDLRISKQAAGQLVDTLVTRGYLQRDVDTEDRRKLTIALTGRGRAAAKVLGTARATVDAELISRVGPKEVERARRTLSVLVEMGNEPDAPDDNGR